MDIIICGAGKRGKELYPFLKYFMNNGNIGKIVGFIDSNFEIKSIDGIPVFLPERINEFKDVIYIITPAKSEIIKFYEEKLQGKDYFIYQDTKSLATLFQIDLTSIQREECAYGHIDKMNKYFDDAESEEMLSRFWGKDSEFKKLFDCLDLTNVIELACGRGRHVKQYLNRATDITLVDILQKNIDYCKNRFGKNNKINYYKNNGYNLSELPSNSYTALFCYDAMVHFELLDINSYLVDIQRVIKKGGKILLHHSNYDAFYDGSYTNKCILGRAFMNYKVFSYLAIHAGFKILNQKIISWEGFSDLDCVTLLEK